MWLAPYGAAVALVFSFAALRTFWRTPRLEHAGAADGRLVVRNPLAGLAAATGVVAVTYLAATRASQRRRPVRIADPAEDGLRGQCLLSATMVCYTVGGIAVLVGT